MKSHLRLYQARKGFTTLEGRLAVPVPLKALPGRPQEHWHPPAPGAGPWLLGLLPGDRLAVPWLTAPFFSLLSWLQFASSGLFTIWLLWFLI